MNRPRRSLQQASYEDPSDSDSQDEESLASMSDSSDSLSTATASEEEPSYSREVVRLPTAAEIIETQQLVRTRMTELATFKLEYEEAKRKLELIEAKCLTITREILESNAYLARVRALPQEVLSLVFSFYTEDPSQSPWTLMQVTRAWRMTALFTRTIWTKIMIASPVWKEQGEKRSYEGREVCVNQQQLDRALRRAGHSPLDIVVACDRCHSYRRDTQAFKEMVSMLTSPQRRSLLRHLKVKGPFTWLLQDIESTSLNFPELETLIIPVYSLTRQTEALLKTSKRIIKLSTTAVDFICYAKKGFAVPSELRDVFIDAKISFLGDVHTFQDCLERIQLLTNLEIVDLDDDHLLPATTITLPNLRTLVLRNTTLVWYLHAPSLTSLTCSGACLIRKGPAGSNRFPLLKSLRSFGAGNKTRLEASLEGVPLPSLQALDLFCSGNPLGETILKFIYEHSHKLVTFRLQRATTLKKDLADLVCSMPLLEELELQRVSITKGFFAMFAPPNTSSKTPASLPCHSFPCLTRLKVDLRGCLLRGQTKAIKAEAKRVVKARLKAGIAMEMGQIRFSEEEGWIDLLP